MTVPESDLEIRRRLAIVNLPAMPEILAKLMEYCQAEDIGINEIADLIAKDTAMTAKILRVANSSGYHRRTALVSLDQSLMAIGIDMVKTLLINESVFQLFDNLSQRSGRDLCGFWKHALTAAVTARLIAERMGDVPVEEAYLAGLLHDVGRLALLAIAPTEYAPIFYAPDDANLCSLEQRTLQISHEVVGAMMIEHWKLGPVLADSVLRHHDCVALLENASSLVRAVCLAHHLMVPDPDEALQAAAALCGLTVNDLAFISSRAADQVVVAAQYLGIDLDRADEVREPGPVVEATAHAANERLRAQVHNLVMATELSRNWARQGEGGELLEAITRSAIILFDFSYAALLLVDGSGEVLEGFTTGEQDLRLTRFVIPLAEQGLIAQAALQSRVTIVDRAENPIGESEQQLLRAFGAESLVCLPLGNKDRHTGVLVGGAALGQLREIQKRESFLLTFGIQADNALSGFATRRRAEIDDLAGLTEQFQQASRRVAHEVNSPLSIIKNYLSVLDRKLARNDPVDVELSILNEEIDRVGRLINNFAELRPAPISGLTEINAAIDDVVRLFSTTEDVPPVVKIVVQIGYAPCQVECDADTLKQILINLIRNAVEASPAGGTIEIGNNGVITLHGRRYCEIQITDTGSGMPAAMMTNLFTPVRSTKGGDHRGLGLSIVHGLVTQMQGLIRCRTGKDGTTFTLSLPVSRLADAADSLR